jgi:predicted AlkP superfamily phosphohydrolase/phosphomutase
MHRPALLLVGLDGADPGTTDRLIDQGRLPRLAALGRRGVRRPIRSTVPAATYPAWTTALTGVNPGRHGVFDFTVTEGYRVRFGAPRPAVPTWLESLGAAGLRVGAIGFPGRLHGERLSAFHVAGWESPLEGEAGRRHVRPHGLYDEILRRVGPRAFEHEAVDELRAADGAWRDRLADALRDALRARTELALAAAAFEPVDVLAVHYQAVDTAGHHGHPPHGTRAPEVPPAIAAVYDAADEAVGRLIDELGPERVVVVSDHGMGPTAGRMVSLNALLAAGGFQRRRPPGVVDRAARWARGTLPALLPGPLRRTLVRLAGEATPSIVESHARFAGIDFPRTAAYSDDLTYAPSVRLNVRGRDPDGRVAPDDRTRTALEIADFLRAARLPDGGALCRSVRLREETYEGPFTGGAPDLLLELAPDGDGALPALCPPHLRAHLGDGWHAPIPPEARAGRKGGVLRGSHRPLGLLVADPAPAWAAAERTLDLRDVGPLACELLGVPEPPGLERSRHAPLGTPAPVAPAVDAGLSPTDRRAIARRLRALGYIDDGDG